MCKKANSKLTWQQMEHAVKRNFGGLAAEDLDPFNEFSKRVGMDRDLPNLEFVHENVSLKLW